MTGSRLLLLLMIVPGLCACEPRSDATQAPQARPASLPVADAALPEHVLATVNGVPITEADLRLQQQLSAHRLRTEPIATPEWRRNVTETLIRRELFAQRAVQLGLDADPGFHDKLHELEAKVAEFRREQLAALFQQQVVTRAQPTDVEARRYFDENAARLRTVLRVSQILVRDQAAIDGALQELERGVSFDEVASRRVVASAPDQLDRRPWEMEVRYFAVPPAWRGVVFDLKDGERSGVLRDGDRFWIIQVLGRREDPEITYESSRAPLLALLGAERLQAVVSETEQALRGQAQIIYNTGDHASPRVP